MNSLDKIAYIFIGLFLFCIGVIYCAWFFNYNDDKKIKKFINSDDYKIMIRTNADNILNNVNK